MSDIGERRTTARSALGSSLGASEAARSMPRDSSPRILRGARLATMTMCLPRSWSGV